MAVVSWPADGRPRYCYAADPQSGAPKDVDYLPPTGYIYDRANCCRPVRVVTNLRANRLRGTMAGAMRDLCAVMNGGEAMRA